jgi:outer membrane receptor protein involved in Fe transport
MKTSTLRNAISIALLAMVTGTVGMALAQEAAADTTIVTGDQEENAEQEALPVPAPALPPTTTSNRTPPTTDLESVTVTGTRIRGGTTPSPVIAIGSERIREEGFTDLGEVIRSVPQNFSGGQNPGVLMGNVTGGGLANQNVTGGSGLNLRGLGADATLTLLNGRRMSYGGFVQAVDISAIPVEAVERIEIVADGASAIYGSDAVGGVGNVMLRRDFEGVRLGARYGAATGGGLGTREYTGTAGTTWNSGGLMVAYKNVSIDPIHARQRDYTRHLPAPTTIYPGSDLRSGLLSAHQSLKGIVDLRLDASSSRREQDYAYYFNSHSAYNRLTPETTSRFVAPGIDVVLPHGWTLSLSGSWGRDEHRTITQRLDRVTGALVQDRQACFCNQSRMYEIGAEGPVFETAAGEARLAIGTGYRNNAFENVNLLTGVMDIDGREGSRFAYAELNLPLIGAGSADSQPERLVATAALRNEHYDSFGSVTTPKVGLIWRPGASFTLKSSWGKSFKAPTLHQRFSTSFAQIGTPGPFGGTGYQPDETVVAVGGGNPDLAPERADTWSASVAWHPRSLPGLEAELTGFYIAYDDRVVQPINNYADALRDPVYAEFVVFSPESASVLDDIAAANVLIDTTSGLFDPDRVFALFYARFVNATTQRIKGIDLSGSYRFMLPAGQLTLRGSTSWLDSTQQTLGMPAAYDLAGTLHNPAKVNSRLGVIWNRGGVSASAFASYLSGVRNRSDGVKGASFTSFDATLRYDAGERRGAWSGLQFALTANNMLNRNPPLYATSDPDFVAPYDSTNYPAIGRFLSLSVAKQW